MNLRDLRYFRVIAASGTLSRAAVGLRIAQPALSRRMFRLEQELGVELLRRTPRGVTLTDAGSALLKRATRIERSLDETLRELAKVGTSPGGRLRVGVQSSPALLVLIRDVVIAYRSQCPDVALHVRERSGAAMIDGLLNTQIDIAILDVPMHAHPELSAFPLWSEALKLVGPAAAADVEPFRSGHATFTQLAELAVISPGSQASIRQLIDEAFCAERLRFRPAFEAATDRLIFEFVKGGLGYTIMPASELSSLETKDQFVTAEINPRIVQTVSIATRSSPVQSRAVASFMHLARAAAAKLAAANA